MVYDGLNYFYEQALGVERVNGSYRQNQRDEGGGLVTNFLETCEIYHLDGLKGLMIKSKGQFRSEMTSEAILRSKLPRGCPKLLLEAPYSEHGQNSGPLCHPGKWPSSRE